MANDVVCLELIMLEPVMQDFLSLLSVWTSKDKVISLLIMDPF